jgi:sigma-54-specific transcriptional regulator
LENVIHHALLVCRESVVRLEDLRLSSLQPRLVTKAPADAQTVLQDALLKIFERGQPNLHAEIEAAVMRTAYEYCHRNQLQTARLLGVSRNIVRARLIECGELRNGR